MTRDIEINVEALDSEALIRYVREHPDEVRTALQQSRADEALVTRREMIRRLETLDESVDARIDELGMHDTGKWAELSARVGKLDNRLAVGEKQTNAQGDEIHGRDGLWAAIKKLDKRLSAFEDSLRIGRWTETDWSGPRRPWYEVGIVRQPNGSDGQHVVKHEEDDIARYVTALCGVTIVSFRPTSFVPGVCQECTQAYVREHLNESRPRTTGTGSAGPPRARARDKSGGS